jgi:hypothetical protein
MERGRSRKPPLPCGARGRNFAFDMPSVTLKAHFDGSQIRLDEPFEIPANSPLMVTVLPLSNSQMDRDSQAIARQSLARAYGDEEPDYSDADVRK